MKARLEDYDHLIAFTDGKQVLNKKDIPYFLQFQWCNKKGRLTERGASVFERVRTSLKKAQRAKPFGARKISTTKHEWAGEYSWMRVAYKGLPATTNRRIIYIGKPYDTFKESPVILSKQNYQMISTLIKEAEKAKTTPVEPIVVQKVRYNFPSIIWAKSKKGDTHCLSEIYYDLCVSKYKEISLHYARETGQFVVRAKRARTWENSLVAIIAPVLFSKKECEDFNFSPYGGSFEG